MLGKLLRSTLLANGGAKRHFVLNGMRNYAAFINAADLSSQLKSDPSLLLIDCRSSKAFAQGHVPGARNSYEFFSFLLENSGKDGLDNMASHFSSVFHNAGLRHKDQRIVLYEDGTGVSSCRGAFIASWLGLPNAGVLHGGMDAWKASGLPVAMGEETESAIPGDAVQLSPTCGQMATAADIAVALENGDAGLLDDRDEAEWKGTSSAPGSYGVDFCPRKGWQNVVKGKEERDWRRMGALLLRWEDKLTEMKPGTILPFPFLVSVGELLTGRIPGAKWVLWTRLMEKKNGLHLMKQPEQIRSVCKDSGFPDLDQPIIIYCFKGARASNTHAAMQSAGFTNVRNYIGSWNEWSRNPQLPIDSRIL